MGILKDGIHVEKKEFSFPISAYLNDSIDALINACNTNDTCADCYMDELYNDINNSLHVDLTDDQAEELRDYYLRGGMYESD